MYPHEIDMIRHTLPERMTFQYYTDRESPWLLSRRLGAPARVADLRRGPLARYLERPLVKPVVAECGGVLLPGDVWSAAHADLAAHRDLSRAATAGAVAAFDMPWHAFELSFDSWGTDASPDWAQISRAGGNLVIQMGFPADHAYLMAQFQQSARRKRFECDDHPIRGTGRPTLAWARLDIDPVAGIALVEEVQSDWLRLAKRLARCTRPESAARRMKLYRAELEARYGRIWPKAMLLAVLTLLVEELGIREIWMHQPEPGAVYKHIRLTKPPVSLYSSLPKGFGFAPVAEAPAFLSRYKPRAMARFRRRGVPIFWRLSL